MKQSLLAILIVSVCGVLSAQSLTIDPIIIEETFVVDLGIYQDLEMHTMVTNNSDEDMELKWVRTEINAPDAWMTQVCDNNTCYSAVVSSNIDPDLNLEAPVLLGAGESFELIFHIIPSGTAGLGEFEVSFAPVNDPDNILATATFNGTIDGLTNTIEVSPSEIRLYPNPTSDFIQLNDRGLVDQLVIYDVLGNKVRTFEAKEGKQYRIADLASGLYLISLVSNESGVLKTLRLNKRSVRP